MQKKGMTYPEAENKLAAMWLKKGGEITEAGRFLDLEGENQSVLGYGIVPLRKGRYTICSVPR